MLLSIVFLHGITLTEKRIRDNFFSLSQTAIEQKC